MHFRKACPVHQAHVKKEGAIVHFKTIVFSYDYIPLLENDSTSSLVKMLDFIQSFPAINSNPRQPDFAVVCTSK